MSAGDWLHVLLWALGAAVASALWFYRTGKKAGELAARTMGQLRRSTDDVNEITATVKRELKRVEAAGEAKADAKALIALEERFNLRVQYLDSRLTELATRYDKRFDDGTERMSKIGSQVTKMVDQVRQDLIQMRERVVRVEERQQLQNGDPHGR